MNFLLKILKAQSILHFKYILKCKILQAFELYQHIQIRSNSLGAFENQNSKVGQMECSNCEIIKKMLQPFKRLFFPTLFISNITQHCPRTERGACLRGIRHATVSRNCSTFNLPPHPPPPPFSSLSPAYTNAWDYSWSARMWPPISGDRRNRRRKREYLRVIFMLAGGRKRQSREAANICDSISRAFQMIETDDPVFAPPPIHHDLAIISSRRPVEKKTLQRHNPTGWKRKENSGCEKGLTTDTTPRTSSHENLGRRITVRNQETVAIVFVRLWRNATARASTLSDRQHLRGNQADFCVNQGEEKHFALMDVVLEVFVRRLGLYSFLWRGTRAERTDFLPCTERDV